MRVLYVQAGVIAEGRTDLRFLPRLLDRMLPVVCSEACPGAFEIAGTIALGDGEPRDATSIASIIEREYERVLLFVLHADGAGDFAKAKLQVIEPKISAARNRCGARELVAVACIPVRETEAWMIADAAVFTEILGFAEAPDLPVSPESDPDPKATLDRVLRDGGYRRGRTSIYELFGENVDLGKLASLPAYGAFRNELRAAVEQLLGSQGVR